MCYGFGLRNDGLARLVVKRRLHARGEKNVCAYKGGKREYQ